MIFLNFLCKFSTLFICVLSINFKILNFNHSIKNTVFHSITISILLSLIYSWLGNELFSIYFFILLLLYLVVYIKCISNYNLLKCLSSILISFIIYMTLSFIIILPLIGLFSYWIFKNTTPSFLDYRIIDILMLYFCYLFTIKPKFSKGVYFIKISKLNKTILFIFFESIFLIILSILIWNICINNDFVVENIKFLLFILLMLMSVLIIVSIFREIKNHYKHTANERTINNLNDIIEKQKEEITRLTNVSKISHKTNHKIDILKDNIIKMTKKEALTTLNELSNDYHNEVKNTNKLSLLKRTNIKEIDEVLTYMLNETYRKNIDFVLVINGSVNYMINKYIDKETLATLLSDHIKNSIIAVEHSKNKFRSITVTIGEIGYYYGISVHDTGISFKLRTLVSLGLKPVTTHKKEGGTGIGFITTFDFLKKVKGNIIIDENIPKENNYSKSLTIIFDDLNEYRIKSYRKSKIKEISIDNRIKFLN